MDSNFLPFVEIALGLCEIHVPLVAETENQPQVRSKVSVPDHVDLVVLHGFRLELSPSVVPFVLGLPNVPKAGGDFHDEDQPVIGSVWDLYDLK